MNRIRRGAVDLSSDHILFRRHRSCNWAKLGSRIFLEMTEDTAPGSDGKADEAWVEVQDAPKTAMKKTPFQYGPFDNENFKTTMAEFQPGTIANWLDFYAAKSSPNSVPGPSSLPKTLMGHGGPRGFPIDAALRDRCVSSSAFFQECPKVSGIARAFLKVYPAPQSSSK